MKEITFIIPCAGKGSRLGAPWPKELYVIDKEVCLIDKCFNHISQFKNICQVVIIISEEKMELVKYLSKYKEDFDIIFCYQKPQFKELGGAIKSAENYLSKKNILLLPDLLLSDRFIDLKMQTYINNLNRDNIAYIIKEEKNPEVLTKLGNVLINEDNIITEVVDKPTIDKIKEKNYQHYWCSFGFTDKIKDQFLDEFDKLISKQPLPENNCLIGGTAVYIWKAIDLGVWTNIHKYFKDLED